MYSTSGLTLCLPLLLLLAACSAENGPPTESSETASGSTAMQKEATAEPSGGGLGRSPSPAGARVYFKNIADGDTVTSPLTLQFGLDGMEVIPAGTEQPMSGHHHIIIDSELPAMDTPIPADAKHIHFGDGSTSTELELPPGEHTLQLLLGDYLHIPHQPPVRSERITVSVE